MDRVSTRVRRVVCAAALTVATVVPLAAYVARTDGHSVTGLLLVGLGLVGLVTMTVAVVVPARLRSLTTALGIDRVVALHRWLGITAIVATVGHLALAVVRRPSLLDPFAASTGIQIGYGALAAMVVVGAVAGIGRRSGRARYEVWARVHVAVAAVALVLAGLHVVWMGDLLADPVMRVVLCALALALLAVLFLRWVWRPLCSAHGAYVVYGVRPEGPSVATLVLAPVHLGRGLRFRAGQFVWLRLRRAPLAGEEHPFTIASSARVTGRLELTVRGSGDFSTTLAGLPVGAKVWLDGPHGSFSDAAVADGHRSGGLVLLAGGVGITPMMSMLRTLAESGDRRPHRLVLAQRPSEPLFDDELDALGRRLDLAVTRTAGRRIDAALLAEVLPDAAARARLDYFVCGSPSVLAGSLAALEQLGVPTSRVHTEQFGWSGPLPVVSTAGTGRRGGAHAR